jgi:hypothetical protein
MPPMGEAPSSTPGPNDRRVPALDGNVDQVSTARAASGCERAAQPLLQVQLSVRYPRTRCNPPIVSLERHTELAVEYSQIPVSYAGDWVTRSIRRRGEPAFR